MIETGFYLAGINTAGILDPVDTARFIGGRIRRKNKLTPGRGDVFFVAAVPAKGSGRRLFEIRILLPQRVGTSVGILKGATHPGVAGV